MRLRVIGRLLEIQRVLVRHGLDEFILATHLFRPLRFVFYLSPATWFERRKGGTRGERIRMALEELGPIFMKLGQALSTRRDLLPPDIADELAKLQDRVPPFPGPEARAIIERAYGYPVSEAFAGFDEAPLAAATIAQVHLARLRSGEEVIVKVVRPGVRARIERDLEVMYVLARLARDYAREGHRLRPLEVVAEYEKTVLDELDLMREAANAAQLKRNFAGSDLLYVPAVHWDHCRPEVMVMERIHGVLVSDLDELRRRGTNIQRLAENGVEIFFTQVFRHNFFHADMHPGNIFVQVDDPEHPRYAAVDFGIVGSLDARDQHYLAENFLAFFEHDYHRVARVAVRVREALLALAGKRPLAVVAEPLSLRLARVAGLVPGRAHLRLLARFVGELVPVHTEVLMHRLGLARPGGGELGAPKLRLGIEPTEAALLEGRAILPVDLDHPLGAAAVPGIARRGRGGQLEPVRRDDGALVSIAVERREATWTVGRAGRCSPRCDSRTSGRKPASPGGR